MPRTLGPRSRLETLRKEAKGWLRDLRAGDAESLDRFRQAWPSGPAEPGLRDVQHALAREFGLSGWAALKEELAMHALARRSRRERADEALRHAAWDGDFAAAARIVARHPEIAEDSLCAAVVCGDVAEVRRRLALDPGGAARADGPLKWPPLLYLAHARTPVPPAPGASLGIAGALLDAGADPNAGFEDEWGNRFTVLTGVIGLGEESRPPHPDAAALATLLIDRGAEPLDLQALYNLSVAEDGVGWLDLLWRRSAERGGQARWTAVPEKPTIGGRIPLGILDYLLGNAVSFNHLQRVHWLLRHGAAAGGVNAYSGRRHHEVAQLAGFHEMADLLVREGAEPVVLTGREAFQAACMRLDRPTALELARADPSCLLDPESLVLAAGQGRSDVVALLLSLGVPVDVERTDGMRALHAAAQSGAVAAAEALVRAGAEIDRRGSRHQATPLGFAVHGRHAAMIDLLAPLSRDVFSLTRAGRLDRLAAVLDAEPALARAVRPATGMTPLFALPDDEDEAAAAATMLLARGADPLSTNGDGETPAQAARKRGLEEAARLIESRAGRRRSGPV